MSLLIIGVGNGGDRVRICMYIMNIKTHKTHLHTHENRGDVAELKKRGEKPPSPTASFSAAARDWRTWVLALQVGK